MRSNAAQRGGAVSSGQALLDPASGQVVVPAALEESWARGVEVVLTGRAELANNSASLFDGGALLVEGAPLVVDVRGQGPRVQGNGAPQGEGGAVAVRSGLGARLALADGARVHGNTAGGR